MNSQKKKKKKKKIGKKKMLLAFPLSLSSYSEHGHLGQAGWCFERAHSLYTILHVKYVI